MEKDITILEEILKEPTYYMNNNLTFEAIQIRAKAIENLIKGYRKSEIENQSYRDYLGEPPCYDNASYIPKSKVKEKMEELDKKIRKIENKKVWNEPADTVIRNRLCNYYNALKELMEDKLNESKF